MKSINFFYSFLWFYFLTVFFFAFSCFIKESFIDSLYSEIPEDYDDIQDEQPITSNAHPRASRAFSTNTSTPSECTDYSTNTSRIDGDTFLPYLCKRIQDIRDPSTRRILENRLLKAVMEAEDSQPQ